MTTALLVIDVQEAMFSYPGMSLYEGEQVLERIASLIAKARSAGTPVIYIQHTEDEGEFVKGTPAWEINSHIAPLAGERVIEKTTPDSFHLTGLQPELERLGVNELYLCGMQTDYCVNATSRRASALGYSTVLVKDAHSTFDNDTHSGEEIVNQHNQDLGSGIVTLRAEQEISFT
ncbi:cysteine hydrolase family protein [Paenibacillus sp. MMS20-IR301]|uniref:cysteine hydrolase family protein n=1 Tax=Paenibacillus sp. MMS20-IR301 TaxID=2895946 RepID=UPI0028E4ABE3|nr:cysteine hydrolase family protein [Paenibacillus sp. MMS20-IR301]WNS45087.1 cysteine hydrolase family protein [Paenibacillus sp. MMS20-IR301]